MDIYSGILCLKFFENIALELKSHVVLGGLQISAINSISGLPFKVAKSITREDELRIRGFRFELHILGLAFTYAVNTTQLKTLAI